MAKWEDIQRRRIAEAEEAQSGLLRLVRKLKNTLYTTLVDFFVDSMDTAEGGTLKRTTGNLTRVQGVAPLVRRWYDLFRRDVTAEAVTAAERVVDLNDRYFGAFGDVQDVRERARLEAFLRWGYNANTGEVLAGSYLEGAFSGLNVPGITQRVAGLMNQAISRQMPLAEFRRVFRGIFTGAGFIERDFNRATFDLFQRLDRTVNLIYADRLGYDDAIYSGTVMDTTRPFCEERVNKVYSREEIESWAKLEFEGKTKPLYDPFIDCGGYNCRHHHSFVSAEVAAILRKRQNG